MRTRNIVVLTALIIVIVGLTVVEKYKEHRERAETREQTALSRLEWEGRLNRMFEARWRQLSDTVRTVLDSLARQTLASGVSPESLVTVLAEAASNVPATAGEATADTADASTSADNVISATTEDSLPAQAARDYKTALSALPRDLSGYERRIATDEVVSLIRLRYGMTESQFDSLVGRPSG